MKEIFINVDFYNSEGIKTIQGNNNAEIYKIYVLENKRRLNLANKTIKFGYVMAGTTKGDIIENLNITNAEQGEITFPITNRISKQDGVYSCQLAIYGADEFLEYTATFGLTVEANIFTKIAGEIADSKDFTYLENILDKASKLSEKLKENTSSATNANSNLESNITEANNINSKLLENTSTATSLNKNLESNIDLAKEVKETIKDLDTKNTEATEKIETLTGLNSKAEELSNNINKGLPLNSELIKNVESAKTANNELIATNNDAKAKKTDLDNSLEEAKKYIAGLDGSKNPVQMQLDINELKNGLKSNQSLSYEGSSIAANNTLEGRTEGMRIVGRTLNNLIVDGHTKKEIGVSTTSKAQYSYIFRLKENTKYTVIWEIEDKNDDMPYFIEISNFENKGQIKSTSKNKGIGIINTTTGSLSKLTCYYISSQVGGGRIKNVMVLEGDWTNKEIPSFFEGLKSFGEVEKVEDKYKISILSHNKNLINLNDISTNHSSVTFKKENDSITIEGESNSINWGCVQVIQFLKKGTYFFNYQATGNGYIRALVYDAETLKSISSDIYPNRGREFTNDKDRKILIKLFLKGESADSKLINKYWDIQLEEGTQATSYEPPKSDKKDILIKEPLKEREYIYEDNGQVKVYRPTKQYTFTGNETSIIKWATVTDESFIGFCITNYDIPNLTSNRSLVVCNNFPSTDGVFNKRNMYIAGNRANICIEKSALTTPDIEGFRAWLKANPTTIVYQLATPTVEIVENCVDIDLDTFQDKTYFNILNSLPGTLDFKVPSNIGSLVQSNAKEINNINEFINNFILKALLEMNKDLAAIKIKNGLN